MARLHIIPHGPFQFQEVAEQNPAEG